MLTWKSPRQHFCVWEAGWLFSGYFFRYLVNLGLEVA